MTTESRVLGVLFLVLGRAGHAAPLTTLEPKVGAFFEQHCSDCHDSTTQKGDFRMDNLSPKVRVENTPQWLEVDQLRRNAEAMKAALCRKAETITFQP